MSAAPDGMAEGLLAYVDSAPSPFHACEQAARRLDQAGFRRLREPEAWEGGAGRYYVRRGGSLAAWIVPEGASPRAGFRVLGAHTDSPNLRVKPRPDGGRAGYRQLGVEVYGGALLNSWLDRDLGLSGRVWLRGEEGPRERLFLVSRPILRVPQLAIHLHREIATDGLKLDKQAHMQPVWGLGQPGEKCFRAFLADELDVEPDAILSWEAMCHDTAPARRIGPKQEFLSAPRLDNLCSCFCELSALLEVAEEPALAHVPVMTLFDHEEVGSQSRSGADGPFLRDLLERCVLARGGSREDFHRALADSVCLSADMAHAVHPNYPEKHDPEHHVRMNEGPVIKQNANLRYASEGRSEALFQQACERADVPCQKWVMRNDLACGSTIGPMTAAGLGIPTVDVGCAQLAMHSARELCGALDPSLMARAMRAFLLLG